MLGYAGYFNLPYVGNVQASNVLKINVKLVDRLVSTTCLSELCRGGYLRVATSQKGESPVVRHPFAVTQIPRS